MVSLCQTDRAAFDILSTTPRPFHYSDPAGGTSLMSEWCPITLDPHGFGEVRHLPLLLAPPCPPEGTGLWTRDAPGRAGAERALQQPVRCNSDESSGRKCRGFLRRVGSLWATGQQRRVHLPVKLEPGEVLVMENNRVLHDRGGWSTAVDRKLQGCYVDIDELRSRLRASEEADGEPQQVGGWL